VGGGGILDIRPPTPKTGGRVPTPIPRRIDAHARRKVRARHSVQCWVKLIVDFVDVIFHRARVKSTLVKNPDWSKLHLTLI
jgi:hypothetical protein